MRSTTPSVLRALAALVAATCTTVAFAGPLTGAIQTTTADGSTVNANLYPTRGDVYLNGGPQNTNANGLPDGTYYFQVTDPSGAVLLSSDGAASRQLLVQDGRVSGAANVEGAHANGTPNQANLTLPVQLAPFDRTPNPGGEYKVWLIPQTADTWIDQTNPRVLHFSDSKTDNFKVVAEPLTISAPADVLVCNDKGLDGAYVTLPTPNTTGGVGNITITYLPASGSFFKLGTTNVTATATDESSDSVSCTFNVTVKDCEGPRFATGSAPVYSATLPVNACGVIVGYSASLFTDPSGVESVTFTPSATTALAAGTHSVGYTAVDGLGNRSTGSFLVTISDRIPPVIVQPADITQGNDPGKCSAIVNFPLPVATDCNLDSVTTSPASGSEFAKGSTVVNVLATDLFGNHSATTFVVTVVDREPPVITTASLTVPLQTIYGSTVAPTATAVDNCDGSVAVIGTRSDGLALTDLYPLGTTVITWTASDSAGNLSTSTQTVTVVAGTVTGTVFYDNNTNGVQDGTEAALNGWKLTLTGTDSAGNAVGPIVLFTSSGTASFANLPLGTYTVTEATSLTGKWYLTSPSTVTKSLTWDETNLAVSPAAIGFGLVQVGGNAGGLTIGFWGNKNGQATLGGSGGVAMSTNLAALGRLNLRTATGAFFTPVTYSAYASWLQSAKATNMAYMLSAQLTAMYNNVNVRPNAFGGVSAGAYLYAPSLQSANSAGFINVSALINEAAAALGANGSTVTSSAIRTYQEQLKTTLDNGNNNLNFVQANPGPFSF